MRSNKAKLAIPPPACLVNAQPEQDRIARTKDLNSISGAIYKGPAITINDPTDFYHGQPEWEVRYALRKMYFNKCAYCENISFKADVEHYRPKKKVFNPQGNNSGYYWLCYEWSNLIPACFECNSRSGKWNHFPVSGVREIRPPLYRTGKLNFNKCDAGKAVLKSEKADLFHPEYDNIEPFIKVEWDGKLAGKGRSAARFDSTIKVCDLNRGNLIYARKTIIDNYAKEFESVFASFRLNVLTAPGLEFMLDERLKQINDASNVSKPYSIVSLFIKNNFTAFIKARLPLLAPLEEQVLLARFAVVNP